MGMVIAKRRLFTFLLMGVISLSGFLQAAPQLKLLHSHEREIRFELTIDSAQVGVVSHGYGEVIEIPGFVQMGDEGEVPVPVKTVTVALPPGTVPTLRYAFHQPARYPVRRIMYIPRLDRLTGTWQPAGPSAPRNHQPTVTLLETGYIREQYVAVLQIRPATFDTAARAYTLYRYVDVSVELQPLPGKLLSAVPMPVSEPRDTLIWQGILNRKSAQRWKGKPAATGAAKRADVRVQTEKQARVIVEENGWYRVSGSMLMQADVDFRGRPTRGMRVLYKNQEIPCMILNDRDGVWDEEDIIVFYGEIPHGPKTYRSQYTDENVYQIAWAETPGMRLVEADGGVYVKNALEPTHFLYTQRFEEDYYWDRLLLVEDEEADHWFWKQIRGRSQEEVSFELSQIPDGDTAYVTLAFMGNSHPDNYNPDHSVAVFLNEGTVGAWTWDGQTPFLVRNHPIPAGLLKKGTNILTLKENFDSDAADLDQFYFNWFVLSFPKRFQAQDNFIRFTAPAGFQPVTFQIQGFTSDALFILDSSGRRFVNYELVRQPDRSFTLRFQDRMPNSSIEYVVLTADHFKEPVRVEADFPANLRSTDQGADMIVIAPQAFIDGVVPLVEHRRRQGLRTVLVDIQDIYDEFSGGVFTPKAIRDFLTYAYEHWQPPRVKYVLLVGDAHFGVNKKAGKKWGKTWIPSYYAYTYSWGITSSDNYFALVSGDDIIPDLDIGRLPCNNAEELNLIVEKIISFETDPVLDEWRTRILLSAGNLDFFVQTNEFLKAHIIPKAYRVPRLDTDAKSKYYGSTEELVDFFHQGSVVMSFVGHGGGGVFFDSQLFLLEDVKLLRNAGKWPILLAWSCFIGYFDDASRPSLGEELLRGTPHGTLANFGSAGRAWLYGDFFFQIALFRLLFQPEVQTLGELATLSKIMLFSQYGGYGDLVINYNLLGDPAMRLGLVRNKMELEVENPSLVPGEPLRINVRSPADLNGTVLVEAYTGDDSLLARNETRLSKGSSQIALSIPAGVSGSGFIRSYGRAESTEYLGKADFSVDLPVFGTLRTQPEEPEHLQPHTVFASVTPRSNSTIDTLEFWWNANSDSLANRTLMQRADNGEYRTVKPVTGTGGGFIFYRFRLVEKRGGRRETFLSEIRNYRIRLPAELAFATTNVAITGRDSAKVQVWLQNRGETSAEQIEVHLYAGSGSDRRLLSRKMLLELPPGQKVLQELDWPAPAPGLQQLTIAIDPENRILESTDANNQIEPKLLVATVDQGTGEAFLMSPDSSLAVRIQPGTLFNHTALKFRPILPAEAEAPNPVGNGELLPFRNRLRVFYRINSTADTLQLRQPATVRLYFDRQNEAVQTALKEGSLRALFWDLRLQRFTAVYQKVYAEKGYVEAALPGAGLIGLVRLVDTQPPIIEIKVSGQIFAEGDYISATPQFSILLADNYGLDLSERSVQIGLDDRKIPPQEYHLVQEKDDQPRAYIIYTPTLTPGPHSLRAVVTDIHGNRSEKVLNFKVSDEFQLISLANHPNPFQSETIIAFRLSREASEVNLKIYSVSGRVIRQWQYFNIAGYHEEVWDGRDELGEDVPNGVYYLKFTALQGEQRIERIEKIARLR